MEDKGYPAGGRTMSTTLSTEPPISPLSARVSFLTLEAHFTKKFTELCARPSLKRRVSKVKDPSDVFSGEGNFADPWLVDWLPDEPANPRNWKKSLKWVLTIHLAINCLNPGFTGSSYVPCVQAIRHRFPETTAEVGVLGLSLYMFGQAFGPVLWAPLSEAIGRRQTFLISYPPFILLTLIGAFSPSLAGIMIVRFLAGIFSSSQLSNLSGQMADLWSTKDRTIPGCLAALSPLLGPVLGGIVGGFVAQHAGYKAVFYLQSAIALILFLLWVFLVPETFGPILIQRKTQLLRRQSTDENQISGVFVSKHESRWLPLHRRLKIGITRPIKLLYSEVIVLSLGVYSAVIYGILYLLFIAYPIAFEQLRHWSVQSSGLALLGVGLGMLCGVLLSYYASHHSILNRFSYPSNSGPPPEARLLPMFIGTFLVPLGLFVFAWTATPRVNWIVPVLFSSIFGAGYVLIFTSVITFLMDAYGIHAASAVAANTLMRCGVGGAIQLLGERMFTGLGIDWGITLLAFLTVIWLPIPLLFHHFGPVLRARSRYAICTVVPQPATSANPQIESAVIVDENTMEVTRPTSAEVTQLDAKVSTEPPDIEDHRIIDISTTSEIGCFQRTGSISPPPISPPPQAVLATERERPPTLTLPSDLESGFTIDLPEF